MEPHPTRIDRMFFAGTWYPSDSRRLAALLDNDGSDEGPPDGIRGAILPHAGLRFSAAGQHSFWRRYEARPGGRRPAAVVILAPSHYVPLDTDQVVGESFSAHAVPGPGLTERLLPGLGINLGDEDASSVVEREHAVELLLPLPSRTLSDAGSPVGALLVGPWSTPDAVRRAAQRITRRLPQNLEPADVLWLVSSDFTHYGPRFRYQPWGRGPYETTRAAVREYDTSVVRALAASTATGMLQPYWNAVQGPCTICGRHAIALLLALLQESGGALQARQLSYYTSADLAAEPAAEMDFVCYATVEIGSPG